VLGRLVDVWTAKAARRARVASDASTPASLRSMFVGEVGSGNCSANGTICESISTQAGMDEALWIRIGHHLLTGFLCEQ
jgi:hypothetical protein